jgi:hypothetical protein
MVVVLVARGFTGALDGPGGERRREQHLTLAIISSMPQCLEM